MRNFITGAAIAVAVLGSVQSAAVADGMPAVRGVSYGEAPATCAASKWSGFYAGVQAGTGGFSSQVTLEDIAGLATRHDDNNGSMFGG